MSTQCVAVIGASGYIGQKLLSDFKSTGGLRVKVLCRKSMLMPVNACNAEFVEGDLLSLSSLQGFLEPGCTVVNLAYLWNDGEIANLAAINNLLTVCEDVEVKRLIHLSTAAVVGRVKQRWVSEATPCNPLSEYGRTKLKVERAIIEASEHGFDVAILRPTSVFGPDGDPLKKLAQDIGTGNGLTNYLRACLFGARRMNLVPVSNVITAIEFLMHYEKNLRGEIFFVSDDDSPHNNFAYVEAVFLREFGVGPHRFPRIPLPLSVLDFLLNVMGRDNTNSRCNFAPNKLQDLGFTRSVTFQDALAEYAAWFRSSKLA